MSFSTVCLALDECASVSGRNAKKAVLDRLMKVEPALFKDIVRYAKHPMMKYGISVNENTEACGTEAAEPRWFAIRDILYYLHMGIARPNSATFSKLESELVGVPRLEQKYLRQIINHELKIGINDFDQWFPGLFPKSPVMLCEKWDGEELTGDWVAEPKLDGYRAAVVVDSKGNSEVFSRGNKEFWNWGHIAQAIKDLGLRDVVLDGEFFAGNFGLTGSICKTQKTHPQASQLKFWVFDLLTIEEWNTHTCTRSTRLRKATLAGVLCGQFGAKRQATASLRPELVMVQGVPVGSIVDVEEVVAGFYAQKFEGAVLKNLDAPYVFDRSDLWLKVKPTDDCDLPVVDVKPGKGRHAGRLGAVIVRGVVTYKKKQYKVTSSVGGGFSDEERDSLWRLHQRGKLVGKVVEVRYQDVTDETAMEPGRCALRFAQFVRVRDDK